MSGRLASAWPASQRSYLLCLISIPDLRMRNLRLGDSFGLQIQQAEFELGLMTLSQAAWLYPVFSDGVFLKLPLARSATSKSGSITF